MAKNRLMDTIINSESDVIDTKRYMYKPLGLKDGKKIYSKMSFSNEIFEENKSKGWLDTIPEGAIIQ